MFDAYNTRVKWNRFSVVFCLLPLSSVIVHLLIAYWNTVGAGSLFIYFGRPRQIRLKWKKKRSSRTQLLCANFSSQEISGALARISPELRGILIDPGDIRARRACGAAGQPFSPVSPVQLRLGPILINHQLNHFEMNKLN